MPPFKIVSDFRNTRDQPHAVDRLVEGLERIGIAKGMETGDSRLRREADNPFRDKSVKQW